MLILLFIFSHFNFIFIRKTVFGFFDTWSFRMLFSSVIHKHCCFSAMALDFFSSILNPPSLVCLRKRHTDNVIGNSNLLKLKLKLLKCLGIHVVYDREFKWNTLKVVSNQYSVHNNRKNKFPTLIR